MGKGKKLLLNLWLRNSPAVELQPGQRSRRHRCWGKQMDPTEPGWGGVPTSARECDCGEPHPGLSPLGMCGPHQDVAWLHPLS